MYVSVVSKAGGIANLSISYMYIGCEFSLTNQLVIIMEYDGTPYVGMTEK